MKTKTCTKCKLIKPIVEFSKDKNSRDGLFSWCKECNKKHYQDNKEVILKQSKIYRDFHKKQIKNYRNNHKEERKEYLEKNKEKLFQQAKEYRDFHKEEKRKYSKNINLNLKNGTNPTKKNEI